ncbi:MAG: hypothetical protein K2Z81_17980 [Cyanobacteria bacterium]|nr:hypothetical protein [Cyanobacteriota bacterium]
MSVPVEVTTLIERQRPSFSPEVNMYTNQQTQKITRGQPLLLSFVCPFLAVFCTWTTMHYIDIASGLDRERAVGIKHEITDQQVLIDVFKQSVILGFVAGVVGLSAGVCCFKKQV